MGTGYGTKGAQTDICELITEHRLEDVVVFDTETTGTSGNDEILSISIVDARGNDVFTTFIKPKHHSTWVDAERINHISPAMVRSSPTIDDCAAQITSALAGKLAVGYNVDFDTRMLRQSLDDDHGLSFDTFDVMKEYAKVHGRRVWEDSGRYKYSKLFECAEDYGYHFNAHDAHEDAVATAYCFMSLICDETYIRHVLFERRLLPHTIGMTLLKAMRENIITLVGDDGCLETRGLLVVGEITRGKRKGQKRYECMVNNLRVGVVSDIHNDMIHMSCSAAWGSFPEPVEVNVVLKSDENGQRADASLLSTAYYEDILQAARRQAPDPTDYRPSASVPSTVVPADVPEEEASPNDSESHDGRGCLWLLILAVVLVVLAKACVG